MAINPPSSVAISTIVLEYSAASIAAHKYVYFRDTVSDIVNDFGPTPLMHTSHLHMRMTTI
jgi:hypothetical protein